MESAEEIDPELYAQRQTGKALTRLIIVVGGLQLAGVALWVCLSLIGIVDPNDNLSEFIISQLGTFLLSVVIGIGWVFFYIRKVHAEAEEMSDRAS